MSLILVIKLLQTIQKVVFFFNGGAAEGTATDIYYIDDLKWE
jgi:hypothetical protein